MKPTNLTIFNATSEDYSEIADLLERVSLPVDSIEDITPDMLVLKDRDQIVGCVALESYGPFALLRSVAIERGRQRTGWGSALVSTILDLAKTKGIRELYLLTETASTFFEKHGFQIVDRDDFPEPVKNSREYSLICPQSAIAMKLSLY